MNSVDMCAMRNREKIFTQDFILHPDKWDSIDSDIKRIVSGEWGKIKYLDDNGELSSDINNLPNDKGGIYVFLLSPDIICGLHRYIMYIGRARRQQEFSLRKRCRCYVKDTRPFVAEMVGNWGKYLYLYYLPLDSDDEIARVEDELNRVIIPPCNSKIPERYVVVDNAESSAFV